MIGLPGARQPVRREELSLPAQMGSCPAWTGGGSPALGGWRASNHSNIPDGQPWARDYYNHPGPPYPHCKTRIIRSALDGLNPSSAGWKGFVIHTGGKYNYYLFTQQTFSEYRLANHCHSHLFSIYCAPNTMLITLYTYIVSSSPQS